MSDRAWYFGQQRIIQYNLQMKDTPLMDPEKIARQTQEMGGNVAAINVADSVIWYHTAVHHQRINPYLPQGRDLLLELVEAFHKRDIKVVARGRYMGFEEEVYYQRPEWARRGPDGAPVMIGNDRPGAWYKLYSPCPNSGYVQDSGLDVTCEAFAKYDFDVAFWLGGGLRDNMCWCDGCKRLYLVAYGKPMPDDPALVEPAWSLENAKKTGLKYYRALMKVKPGLSYHRYFWPFDLNLGEGHRAPADNIDLVALEGNTLCTEAQDILSMGVKELPDWNTPALRMKMGRTIENFPPPVGIIHTSPGMDWRHTSMPEEEFLFWAAQIPANGGSYWTTLTGFADTTPDKRMLETVTKFNRMMAKTAGDMDGAGSVCQVMLLSDGGVYVQGWAEALMCAHIDFDMLAHYQLGLERIKKYPVVILPKDFPHTADSQDIFRQYVEQGGNLIVEGTRDEALAPVRGLLGVEGPVVCSEELLGTYLRIQPDAAAIRELVGACDLIPLRGRVGYSHAKAGAQVLATWVPPFVTNVTDSGKPPERASLPASHTDIPLCVVSGHGKGRVMFLPYEPSRLIKEYGIKDLFTMMEAYVDYMLGEAKVLSFKAPRRVMASVFGKADRLMIHLVNGVGQRPLIDTIPCHDIEIIQKLEGRGVKAVRSNIAEQELSYGVVGDTLTIRLPRLDVWDMITIEWE